MSTIFKYDSAGVRTHDLTTVRQTFYHWAITPVRDNRGGERIYDVCFKRGLNREKRGLLERGPNRAFKVCEYVLQQAFYRQICYIHRE